MNLYLDASATVAMLALEPDFQELAGRAAGHDVLMISAMSIWETVSGLRRSHGFAIDEAREQLDAMISENGVVIVTVGEAESRLALDAYARFGKGIDPAGLNMGDCFAYACAKANDARLLYKGADFDRTDLAWPHA